MCSVIFGVRSQHRHYPYWYEGTLSTWPTAKYPRKFCQSIGLPGPGRLTSLCGCGIIRTDWLEHDEIVAVHQFCFGNLTEDFPDS